MRLFYYICLFSLINILLINLPVSAEEIKLQGDTLKIYGKEKRYLVTGNVRAEGDDFILTSDKMELYENEEMSIIEGDFTVVTESLIATCTRAEIFRSQELRRFYNLSGKVLRLSINPQEYMWYDRNKMDNISEFRMKLKTAYLRQTLKNRFFARDVRYTLCNCPDNNTWELSSDALYYEEDGFLLSLSNVIYFYGIPSFYIPAIIVPVGERRSGFLLPETGFTSTTGYSLKNAYYQTLGISADATLYLTLMSRKGEMYSAEFRYRPLENLYGKIMFSFVNDTSDSPFQRRFSLKNEHRYEYSERLTSGLTTNLVSDSSYMYDFLFDFWERNTEYTLSRFYIFYRGDDFLINLSNDYYQNFKQGQRAEEFNFFLDTGLAESQRLPAVSLTLLPQRLIFGTDIMADADYVNYYSFSYDFRKTDYYNNPLITENDRRTLLTFQRFMLVLPLHNYFQIENVLNVNQYLNSALRIYRLPGTSYNLATSLYRLNADIELFRDYSFFTHILKPSLEYKNLFFLEYTRDNRLYYGRTVIKDEKDNYVKSQYFLLHLSNFIHLRESVPSKEIFGIDIAQGYQKISEDDLTPLMLVTNLSQEYIRLSGDLFYYWKEKEPYMDTIFNLTLSDRRGDSLTVKYQKIKNYLMNPLTVFNEEFGYYLPAYYENGLNDIFGSISIALLRELSLSYFITYSFGQDKLLFHGSGINYHSRCNCLNASLTFVMYDWYEFPSFTTFFNLGGNI
ncbi:MAG: hypothetical protein N3B13_00465 [Deltaproteobacteria bacterium]|nr:hypothetical protein [Deltaproteobacteria bacterium]